MTKNLENILSTAAFAGLFLLCLAFVTIRLAGLGTYIVTGGSMEPNVAKGSLVLVQPVTPGEVKIGDAITFQQYDQTTTHRVTAITRDARGLVFHTKGDANVVADPEDKTFVGAVGVAVHERLTTPAADEVGLFCEAGGCTSSVRSVLLGLLDEPVKLAAVSCETSPASATVTMNTNAIASRRSPFGVARGLFITRARRAASASARASARGCATPRRDRP